MQPHILLLGHRGVSGQSAIAENTFAAFDRAMACGCDGFELTCGLRPVAARWFAILPK